MPPRTIALALCLGTLCGCDAWPTTFDNRTNERVELRYHQREYDDWSAPFPVAAGKATSLARAHYADDIVGLRITDSERAYSLSPQGLAHLHRTCSRSFIDRLTTLGDCWLTYHGNGRLTFTREVPEFISYQVVQSSR